MSENEKNGPKDKEKSFFKGLVVPIATALVVGGTAPWWVDLIKNGEKTPGDPEPTSSVDNSNNLQPEDTVINDDSINIQGSDNTVNDNSVIASDQAVVQQNDGSGSNIFAGGDLTINEASDGSATLSVPCVNGGGSGGWMYEDLPGHYFPLGLINVNEWPLRSISDHPMYEPDVPWNTYGTCIIVPAKYP